MDFLSLLMKPEAEINTQNLLDTKMPGVTVFVVPSKLTMKSNSLSIEIDRLACINKNIYEILEPHRNFSEYDKTTLGYAYDVIKESQDIDHFNDLVLGFYDSFSNEYIIDGYIKNINKIDPTNIINWYFTSKNKSLYYSEKVFNKDFESLTFYYVNKDERFREKDFLDFREELKTIVEISSKNLHPQIWNEILISMLEKNFPYIETEKAQNTFIRQLQEVGCLDLMAVTKGFKYVLLSNCDSSDVLFNRMSMIPNERFVGIYRKQ